MKGFFKKNLFKCRLIQTQLHASPLRFRRDRKAGVALIVVMGATPMLVALGMAVDTARMVSYRQYLQDAVDSAALSGATQYGSATLSDAAHDAALQNLTGRSWPSGMSLVSSTVTPLAESEDYKVSITAVATMKTTFIALTGYRTLTLTASAAAINPILTPSFSFGNFGGAAQDADYLSWYAIPYDDQGKPKWGYVPSLDEMSKIDDNCNSSRNAWIPVYGKGVCGSMGSDSVPQTTQQQISTTQPIAFALTNITNGALANVSYGSNQYGSPEHHINNFYSGLQKAGLSPSEYASSSDGSIHYPNSNSDGGNSAAGGGNTNCALVIRKLGPYDSQTSPNTSSSSNKCFNPSSTQSGGDISAISCAEMGSNTYMVQWNDMGGITDDLVYSNAYFTFSCAQKANSNGKSKISLVQ